MVKLFHHYISRWSLLLAGFEALIFFALILLSASPQLSQDWLGANATPSDITRTLFFAGIIVLVIAVAMGATGLYSLEIMFTMDAVLARIALSFSIAFIVLWPIASLLSQWLGFAIMPYRTKMAGAYHCDA